MAPPIIFFERRIRLSIKIITGPVTEPITLQEAKDFLKFDGNSRDAEISMAISAARVYCEDRQNKRYITQTLELILDKFPCGKHLEFDSCSPVQSVTSVKYYDSNGTEYTMDPNNYIVDTDSFVNKITLKNSRLWPSTVLQSVNGVRVRFVAGYGTAAQVPEAVKQAMVLHMRLFLDEYSPADGENLKTRMNWLLGMRGRVNV